MARAQQQFEAMKDVIDEELSELIEDYEDARDRRMKLTEIEVEKRTALEIKLEEKGLKHYRDPETGKLVVLEQAKPKLKLYSDPSEDDLAVVEREKQMAAKRGAKSSPKTVDVKARASGERDEDEDWDRPMHTPPASASEVKPERKLLPPAGGSKKRKKAAA